jgi:hypothetical protein
MILVLPELGRIEEKLARQFIFCIKVYGMALRIYIPRWDVWQDMDTICMDLVGFHDLFPPAVGIDEDAPGVFADGPIVLFSTQIFQWRGSFGEFSFITMHQIMNNSQRIKRKEICPGILRRKDPQ